MSRRLHPYAACEISSAIERIHITNLKIWRPLANFVASDGGSNPITVIHWVDYSKRLTGLLDLYPLGSYRTTFEVSVILDGNKVMRRGFLLACTYKKHFGRSSRTKKYHEIFFQHGTLPLINSSLFAYSQASIPNALFVSWLRFGSKDATDYHLGDSSYDYWRSFSGTYLSSIR